MSSQYEQSLQAAIAEAKRGNRKNARTMLIDVVRSEPGNARAWYLLSQVVDDPVQAVDCLKRVLAIDPNNRQARERLEKLQTVPKATKPKRKLSNSPYILIALVIMVCSFLAFGMLLYNFVYAYYIAPAARSHQKETEAAQTLSPPTHMFLSKTMAPNETATEPPLSTSAETASEIPTLTASAVVQPPSRSGGGICDPSYPTVCIPPSPPDLNCPDIPQYKNFSVLPPDPHGFDRDGNGIGCEE